MANTIRAAKNTFSGGLVMDLAPDTTPNEVLTSALNATLVTFNGNELLLQNDMGNGRVETARLPEGYIPVGTCEFGDIIYIVSYNPLTNKSLIGCFPSPERNISSEEIGSTGQVLTAGDFLELNGTTPTGELKASSVKKIIYENKLNPGDKFIIYDKNNAIFTGGNLNTITDIGNTSHTYGTYPKLVKIHVVAIEDSGKINYLDSSLKWYEEGTGQKDYFIKSSKQATTGELIPDIDSYRNLLSSGYSVFQSKISGKLALLIELEKITGFSCAYSIYSDKEALKSGYYYKNYKIFWNFSWNTDDPNINPAYIILTKSEWSGKEETKKGQWGYWNAESKIAYNSFSGALPKSFPDSGYYEASVLPYRYPISGYNEFIQGSASNDANSYQVILKGTLTTLMANRDYALTKLNIYRETNGNFKMIPVPGKYYINADTITYDTLNGTSTVYTKSTSTGEMVSINAEEINDIIVNNYFNHPVYKEFATFNVPIALSRTLNEQEYKVNTDISNLIYNYEITPAMPYGLLREYSIEGYIDFSKIGTGVIDMNVWKYFVGENVASLTIGLDAYVEENKGIDEVVLEFYDNQGMAAAYHMGNKESYSGQFTESIPLNGMVNSYKLTNTNHLGETKVHCGSYASDDDTNVLYMNGNTPTKLTGDKVSGVQYYLDDCGTLYSNMLYLVKIIVKYCPQDALGNLDTTETSDYRYYYRWMWTTTVFNGYYYNVQDYDNINLTLSLDANVSYTTNADYQYGIVEYNSPSSVTASGSSDTVYQNLSARTQLVTYKPGENDAKTYNTQMYMIAGLENDYNVFNLRKNGENESGLDAYSQLKVDIITSAEQYTENDEVKVLHAGESMLREFEGVYPVLKDPEDLGGGYQWDIIHYGTVYKSLIESYFPTAVGTADTDLWESPTNYTFYKNQFKLEFKDANTGTYADNDKEYISYMGNATSFNDCSYITKSLGDICGEQGKFLYMNAYLMHFSKYYKIYKENTIPTPLLIPLLYDKADLETYGLDIDTNNIPYVKYILKMNFYYGGAGARDEESYTYMDLYTYNSSALAYDGNNSIKNIYEYYGDRDFSVYASNYKSYITFRRDSADQWREIPKGFILFGMGDESSTGHTFNAADYGGMYQENYTYPTSYSATFDASHYRYNFDRKYLDRDGTPLVGIGYYCDTQENFRYFNTYFPVSISGRNIAHKIRYKTGKDAGHPKYIGIVVASLLASLYTYRESLTAYPYVADIIYLDKNATTFTKDIAYHVYCSEGTTPNEILLFKGCKYTLYLSSITGQFTADADKISKNNIEATLKSCVKNTPIQFKMNYLEPNLESTNNINTQSVVKLVNGTEEVITGEVPVENRLYYIDRSDGSYKVKLLDKNFKIRYLKNLHVDAGAELRLFGEFDETVPDETNQYIYKMFNGEGGQLTFEKSDLLSSDIPTYSICTNYHKDCCLHHFRKDDVIAPFAKIF